MASAGNVEDLKIKVGLKYTDPKKEYEFLDKLGEGCVSFTAYLISDSYSTFTYFAEGYLALHKSDFQPLFSDRLQSHSFCLQSRSYGSVLHAQHLTTHTLHAIKQVPVEDNLQDLLRVRPALFLLFTLFFASHNALCYINSFNTI